MMQPGPCYYCDHGGSGVEEPENMPTECKACIHHKHGPTVEQVLQWKRNTELVAQLAQVERARKK